MSWNYRIILHDLDSDPVNHWYGLHEVHYGMPYDRSQPGIGPTKEPITFTCGRDEGKEGIIAALEMALRNLRDPRWGVVLTDSGMERGEGKELAEPDLPPPEEIEHLTPNEQQIMHRALRRSMRIISDG